MNLHFKLATAIVFSVAVAAPAWALNPQPEPPGKAIVAHRTLTGHTTAHGTGGTNADVDTYCGTPVPGHPHPNANCTVHTNTMGGAMAGHTNVTVHTTGHGSAADADDNYCGTPVPGHPHPNANCTVHTNTMGAVHGGTMHGSTTSGGGAGVTH